MKIKWWLVYTITIVIGLFFVGLAIMYPLEYERKIFKVSGEFCICEVKPKGAGYRSHLYVYHSVKCDPDKYVGELRN
jgi:hypothetical protein